MARVAPSILAADFGRLAEQVQETELAGADRVHIDVMDGHFVPNLSMGPVVVRGLKHCTRLPLEVHLMVLEPANFVEDFVHEGADTLIFHREVLLDPRPLLQGIRSRGKKVGLAINPNNPVEELVPTLRGQPGPGTPSEGGPVQFLRFRRQQYLSGPRRRVETF